MIYLLLVLLGLGGAYFAAAETAYASMNKIRIRNYADNGMAKAKKALKISNDFDSALITMLIGWLDSISSAATPFSASLTIYPHWVSIRESNRR